MLYAIWKQLCNQGVSMSDINFCNNLTDKMYLIDQ